MSHPVNRQPIHVAVRKQQEWADTTAKLRSLIPDVPPTLVDHFAKSLLPEPPPTPEPAAAKTEDEPEPDEKPPAPTAATKPAANQPRSIKRG